MMKLLSFGEIVWDIYPDKKCLGGAPLNLAAHAFQHGADAWIALAIGNDNLGEIAMQQMKDLGVKTDYILVIPEKETGKCIVTLDQNALPTYDILSDTAYDCIKMPVLKERFDVIAFGTLALRGNGNMETLSKILHAYSFAEVFTDLNIRPPFYTKKSILFCLENATVVKISEEELPIIAESIFNDVPCLEDALLHLANSFRQIKLFIITRGEHGACCFDCLKNQFYYCNAEPTEVVSTVGAGDSFGAAFLTQYLKGENFQHCLAFASKISSYVCSKKEAIPDGISKVIKSIVPD